MTPEEWRAWLPTPEATALINRLWPDEEPGRESKDSIYTRAIRRQWEDDKPRREE